MVINGVVEIERTTILPRYTLTPPGPGLNLLITSPGSFMQLSYSASVCEIPTVCDPVQLNAIDHHSENR